MYIYSYSFENAALIHMEAAGLPRFSSLTAYVPNSTAESLQKSLFFLFEKPLYTECSDVIWLAISLSYLPKIEIQHFGQKLDKAQNKTGKNFQSKAAR